MPALGHWYTLIFFKNPVLALIYHTLIYHNACNPHFRVTDSAHQKENLGILVQYKVKVKLFLGALGG